MSLSRPRFELSQNLTTLKSIHPHNFRRSVGFFLATMVCFPQINDPFPVGAAEHLSQAPSAVSPVVGEQNQRQPIFFAKYQRISMPTLEASPFQAKPILTPLKTLQGEVTLTESNLDPNQTIQHLVEIALERDKEKELLSKRASFHKRKWTRLIGRSKGMLEYATSYQGFESSSEAADVILGEKLKLKNAAAVEYVRQKYIDTAHLQLTCAIMELATGLGLTDDAKKAQAIQSGLQELTPLVGEEAASECLQSMTAWSKQVKVPEEEFSRESFDVLTLRQKSTELLAKSLGEDDVVRSIETRLHKFNHHSNFARATAKLVNTTLSIVAFSPTMASPAAQCRPSFFLSQAQVVQKKKNCSLKFIWTAASPVVTNASARKLY